MVDRRRFAQTRTCAHGILAPCHSGSMRARAHASRKRNEISCSRNILLYVLLAASDAIITLISISLSLSISRSGGVLRICWPPEARSSGDDGVGIGTQSARLIVCVFVCVCACGHINNCNCSETCTRTTTTTMKTRARALHPLCSRCF